MKHKIDAFNIFGKYIKSEYLDPTDEETITKIKRIKKQLDLDWVIYEDFFLVMDNFFLFIDSYEDIKDFIAVSLMMEIDKLEANVPNTNFWSEENFEVLSNVQTFFPAILFNIFSLDVDKLITPRIKLFKYAVIYYKRNNSNYKTKSGYSYTAALEDVNREKKLIPEDKFDLEFEEIKQHFKTWRDKERRKGNWRVTITENRE